MAIILFGNRAKGQIGELNLDVTLSEVHSAQNSITQYPVEEGFDISDHIVQQPDMLQMSGLITNFPVNLLQRRAGEIFKLVKGQSFNYKNFINGDGGGKVQLARDILYRISGRIIDADKGLTKIKPELVTIVSGLRIYRDMAIEDLSITRNSSISKDSLQFDASFKKLIKVKTETVEIPDPKESVDNKIKDNTRSVVDKKQQTAKAAPPVYRSKLQALIQKLRGNP